MPVLTPRVRRNVTALALAAALLLAGGLAWRRWQNHASGPALGGAVFVSAPAVLAR